MTTADIPSASLQNTVDFYRQSVVDAQSWFKTTTPLKEAIPKYTDKVETTQRGMRLAFWKSQPGGISAPTLTQPSFNRAVAPQSDSMYVNPLLLTIPLIIDLRTAQDAESGKEDARLKLRDIYKLYTDIFAQRVEHAIAGNGSGALAFSASNITTTGAATLTCETTAAAEPGHTKGAIRLKRNSWYQAWDSTTFLPRGTFYVTTEGKSSCAIVVTSGTINSGDPITDVGTYMKFPRGLGHIFDDNNRILQSRDTAVDTILNTPTIDKNGTKFTPTDREDLKTILVIRNGEEQARANLTWITAPGLMSDLRKQQYGFRRYMGDEPVKDVARKYVDADGSTILEARDFDEDRQVGFRNNATKYVERMPFQEIRLDGMDLRNVLGDNQTGSILWQKAWGIDFTLGITDPFAGVLMKRASLSGIQTQVTAGGF